MTGKLQSFVLCSLIFQGHSGHGGGLTFFLLHPWLLCFKPAPSLDSKQGKGGGIPIRVISLPRMFIIYVGPAMSRASLSFHV